ncbi:hypothetical protein Taro_003000, partial [Colocasia esculenta]|nr:hypothetical protein [Colocasia esculenta]
LRAAAIAVFGGRSRPSRSPPDPSVAEVSCRCNRGRRKGGIGDVSVLPLQKESEKAERERKKEKKRVKKEKKEKARGDKERAEAEKRGHKKRHYSELSHSTQKTADFVKTREDDSEQLEKSSLTEEQGGPAAVQSFCDSSDSTQNSSKRSKHESAGVIRITQGGGNGLRIRLPLSRHRETESPVSSERPCFSGRSDTVPPRQETKAVVRLGQPSSIDDQPCFSGRTGATPSGEPHEKAERSEPAPAEPPTSSGAPQRQKSVKATDSCRVHRSRRSGSSRDRETRHLYKKLILGWSPPPLPAENPEDDDQDWLFGGKKTGSSSGRTRQQGEDKAAAAGGEDAAGLGGALCTWPPRACLLPEVGIYALPYVVPF